MPRWFESNVTLLAGTAVLGLGAIAAMNIPALALGTNVTYGLIANNIGALWGRLRQSSHVLRNEDIAKAAGRTVARALVEEVAPHYREIRGVLHGFADRIEGYWVEWAEAHQEVELFESLQEDHLHRIFGQSPEQFNESAVLPEAEWREVVTWLFEQGREKRVLPADLESYQDVIAALTAELAAHFNKHLRQVLKDDANNGGRAFVGMLFDLHGATLAKIDAIRDYLPTLATAEDLCRMLQQLETGVRDELVQIRELLQQYLDPHQARLPIPQYCEAIIAEKTQDFVGRGFVFKAIQDFLRDNPKGYFVLEADPGVGKSAIMARLVQLFKGGCLVHFNNQGTGVVKPEKFLENICTQLIEAYGLDYRPLPAGATEDGNFLERLLGEVAQKLAPGKKLVVVVDALDEVDSSRQTSGSNLLYLPDALPPQVYFILSKRPQPLELPLSEYLFPFDLMQYPAESANDARRYAKKRYGRSADIQDWVMARGLTAEQFLTDLVARSENNFMYLRYVLNDIEGGLYEGETLDGLPRGLRRYYQKHWRLMGMKIRPLPIDKIRIIYVLSESPEPVSKALLAKLAGIEKTVVGSVLEDWEQFLRSQKIENETCYSIYHASFSNFLNEQAEDSGIDLEDINRRMGDNLADGAPL